MATEQTLFGQQGLENAIFLFDGSNLEGDMQPIVSQLVRTHPIS